MAAVVPRTRFERVTLGLEVLCSIQLSYRGISVLLSVLLVVFETVG